MFELANTTELLIIVLSFLILGSGLPYFFRFVLRASTKLSGEELIAHYPNYAWIARIYFPLVVAWTLIVASVYVMGFLLFAAMVGTRAVCFGSSLLIAIQLLEGLFAIFTGVYPLSPTGVLFPLTSHGRKYLRQHLYVCEPVDRIRQVALLQTLFVVGAVAIAIVLTLARR